MPTALIHFTQSGQGPFTPGQAAVGVDGTPVVVSNTVDATVVRWEFTVVDAPPTSAITPGLKQSGSTPTWSFTPDTPDEFLIQLDVFDGSSVKATDFRIFGVNRPGGRRIPAFKSAAPSANFGGQTRGWSPQAENWLHHLDAVLWNDLATLPPSSSRLVQSLDGHTTVADGGQGFAFWNASDVRPADGSTISQVTGIATGRWNRIPTPAQGAAGGDLAGTYPNPTLAKVSSLTSTGIVHTSSSGILSSSLVVDADVDPAAAIAGTKISPNFGSQNVSTTGTLSAGAATATSLKDSSLGTGVVHSDSAGNFTSSLVVNADISGAAAIAYSKLALSNSIVNGDISATAAIAYSKLNLTGSIVDSDIASGAAIAGTKISPNFGSQNVSTTGGVSGGAGVFTSLQDTALGSGFVQSDGAGNLSSGSAITPGSLSPGTAGQVMMTNATPAAVWQTISNDLTLSATGSATVGQISGSSPIAITTAATVQWSSGVASPTLSQASISSASGQALTVQAQGATGATHNGGDLNLSSGTSGSATVGAVHLQYGGTTGLTVNSTGVVQIANLGTGVVHSDSSGNLTSSTIVDADVSASAAIAVSKLAAGTDAQILLNNSGPTPTWTTMSGGATISDTGIVTLTGSKLAQVGTAASRPSSTGSGLLYFCSDVPVLYVDDPNSTSWKQIFGSSVIPGKPSSAGSYVVTGTMRVDQFADALRIASVQPGGINAAMATALISGGGNMGSNKWCVTFTSTFDPTLYISTFPLIGACVSDGTTNSSHAFSVCFYNNAGALHCTVVEFNPNGAQIGGNLTNVDSGGSTGVGGGLFYSRIISDGTMVLFQISGDGVTYGGCVYAQQVGTVSFTNYGFTLGGVINNDQGAASGVVLDNRLVTSLDTQSVSNVTGTTTVTVTTSGNHGWKTGDCVTIRGVGGISGVNSSGTTGTPSNTAGTSLFAIITVTAANQFTFVPPSAASGSFTTGGTVINISKPY